MPRKRNRPQQDLGIPKIPTANIGNLLREEMASSPEVFDGGTRPPSTSGTNGSSSGSTMPSSPAISPQKEVVKTPKKKSLSKRKTKRKVQITKKENLQVYESDFLRNFTESSGTHSYDSPRSTKSFFRHVDKGKLVTSTPLSYLKAETVKSQPSFKCAPTAIESYDQPKFTELLEAEAAPGFGEVEPISAKDVQAFQQQEFVKEMVANALAEFFAAPHDDLVLTMRVRRQGARPVLNVQLAKAKDVAVRRVAGCTDLREHDSALRPSPSRLSTARLAAASHDAWEKNKSKRWSPRRHSGYCHHHRNFNSMPHKCHEPLPPPLPASPPTASKNSSKGKPKNAK